MNLNVKMRRDKAIKYYKLAMYQADLFSKDPNKKVGALFLSPESYQILSLGYNGFPRGINDKNPQRWERPTKYDYVCHAETNCIFNAGRHGTPLEGCIAIVTLFPCKECTKALIQVGVKTLVTIKPDYDHEKWGEEFKLSYDMFEEVGMNIIILEDDEVIAKS
jgi:dCMP deaminase